MPFFSTQYVKVAKRLRRMLAAAVAGVQHRARRVIGRNSRRAVMRMPQYNQVGISANDANRIGEALTLRRRACVHIGRADHRAAEPMHRGFKAEPRPR